MAYRNNNTFSRNNDWKYNGSNDVETDCAVEDEIDGCMPSDICKAAAVHYPEMMGRGFLDNLKGFHAEPQIISKSERFRVSPLNTHRGAEEKEERYDSCYDSGMVETTDSMRLDSEDTDQQEHSKAQFASGTVIRMQEVGKKFEELTITASQINPKPDNLPSHLKDSLQQLKCTEETCLSEDLAYYSEERNNSERLSSVEEEQSVFCDQNKDGDTQPHLCLIHGKIFMFFELLYTIRNPAHLNIQNLLSQTLLHLAVILNIPQVVRKLVAWGADIDRRDRQGNTPLHVAAEKGYFDCVLALTTPLDPREVKDVPYKPPYQRIPQDQDIRNYDGMTCLHLAAHHQHIKIVNHLITKCYADINVQEGRAGETVLHQAVKSDSRDIIEYLLLHRELNIEATRYDGSTALHLAQGLRNRKLINLLVNAGADFSSDLLEEEGSSEDESMSSVDDEFTYDDFKIGGSLVSV